MNGDFYRPFVPQPPERYDRDFMTRFVEYIRYALNNCLSKETANDSILMKSPSGKVYQMTINDSGAWVSTYIRG